MFFGHGTDNALDEAAALVLQALYLPPDLPSSWFCSRLTIEERNRVFDLIQRRIEKRMPLAYLMGEAWFAGMRFHVNEQVLIPRSPIAELIEKEFSPWVDPLGVTHVLDLCCGSGLYWHRGSSLSSGESGRFSLMRYKLLRRMCLSMVWRRG